MEELFNPVSILLHLINAFILFVAVSKLVYKPVRKFLKAREDKIDQQLLKARLANEEVEVTLQKREELLQSTDAEIASRLAEGQKRLKQGEERLLADAQAKGDEIIARAHQEADTILLGAHEAMEAQVAKLGMEVARKILKREIRMEDHEHMISDFLKKVG